MIYSSNISVLNERTEFEVKISNAFTKAKNMILGKDTLDTSHIDKMIKEIEGCNKKIEEYKNASKEEKDKIRDELKGNKELLAKMLREYLWILPCAFAVGYSVGAFNILFSAVVDGMFIMLMHERLSIDNFYNKLEAENNKALKWLKEEKASMEAKKSVRSKNEAVALFGQDADEFLESVEVALYEDAVAIGENLYDGADAEAFLAENGIHLYEDHIVLEGQQAEEYKARKKKEERDKYTAESNRNYNRYSRWSKYSDREKAQIGYRKNNPGSTYDDSEKAVTKSLKYSARGIRGDRLSDEEKHKRVLSGDIESLKPFEDWGRQMAADAINRHIRRHPKNESTIFDFDMM